MLYTTDAELKVVALLRDRGRIDVSNLSWVTSLPVTEYRRALGVLAAAIDSEIDPEVTFISKLCFSDSRARAYYKRIFGWWQDSMGDTERPSLELALLRTYSKSQCSWTWGQLRSTPAISWPLSVVRRMWKDEIPRDLVRRELLSLLDSGLCNISMLIEISRINDSTLTSWFLAQPDMPREIIRTLPVAPSKEKRSGGPSYLLLRDLDDYQEVFSADIDEVDASHSIFRLTEEVGWRGVNLQIDVGAIVPNKYTIVWRELEEGIERLVVATRDDQTTLIVRWLIKHVAPN